MNNGGQQLQKIQKKRGRRPTPLGELDRKVAKELGDFILNLANEYDLSPQTARAKSHGLKRFRTHRLTNKEGLAKRGGLLAGEKGQIDRYVSYRIADANLSLCAWLALKSTLDQVRFQVFGPKSDFQNPSSWNELRQGVELDKPDIYGQEYTDLEEAKDKFKTLIEHYADRK